VADPLIEAHVATIEAENEDKARDIFWAELPDNLTNNHIRVEGARSQFSGQEVKREESLSCRRNGADNQTRLTDDAPEKRCNTKEPR
jgi:hypothetical protein